MKFNSITVAPIRSVEVGDFIAKEFLRGLIYGRVTGIVYFPFQLTPEQRAYMVEHKLDIPENENESLTGGSNYVLVFGTFKGDGLNHDQPDHIYVNMDTNVAIFPIKED